MKINKDYNGRFSDSEPFAAYLERFFPLHGIKEDEKWWVRDWLSSCWNAALDYSKEKELTKEERIKRADSLDDFRSKS